MLCKTGRPKITLYDIITAQSRIKYYNPIALTLVNHIHISSTASDVIHRRRCAAVIVLDALEYYYCKATDVGLFSVKILNC